MSDTKESGFVRELEGHAYLRKTSTGEIVFDLCPSDSEHMNAPVSYGHDRRRCRITMDMLFDEEYLGRRGKIRFYVEFTADDLE